MYIERTDSLPDRFLDRPWTGIGRGLDRHWILRPVPVQPTIVDLYRISSLVVDLGYVLDVDADVDDGERFVGQVELGVVARDTDGLAFRAHFTADRSKFTFDLMVIF